MWEGNGITLHHHQCLFTSPIHVQKTGTHTSSPSLIKKANMQRPSPPHPAPCASCHSWSSMLGDSLVSALVAAAAVVVLVAAAAAVAVAVRYSHSHGLAWRH